jgi:tetratricopeptide (TPR) repeat protein
MRGSSDIRATVALAVVMLLPLGTAFGQAPAATSPDDTSRNAGPAQDQRADQSSGAPQDSAQPGAEFEKQIESARQYVLERNDKRAVSILHDVLGKAPSNREAKLELALILGYREDYKNSDRLYRELLAADPNDEAAALGLIRNLLRERRTSEAQSELQQALALHPNSILLQESNDRAELQQGTSADKKERRANLVQAGESFFADSAGNRSLLSTQLVQYQVNRFVESRLRLNELSLWNGTGPRANVLTGADELQFRLTRFLAVMAEGGVVRFADQSTRSVYSGDVQLSPYSRLELLGGYSRTPVSPTFNSTQFDLLAEGWHAGLNWHPKFLRIRASFSRENYSDGNRAERERAEIIHWTGGSRFALGAGYEFTHDHFLVDLNHGYFSPDEYRRHLAEAGIRFRIGKAFRAEYLGRGGVESISNGSWTRAGELLLRNRLSIRRWQLGIDYSRMQVAQSTGALQANWASVTLGYEF